MADTIPMLRKEQRRHLLMNGWLIAGFIVVGTAVTNERGIFRPIDFGAFSATARAFIAIASPAGLNPDRLRDVRSVSALDPFEVTAPSRDLRRRLIDALDWVPGQGDEDGTQEPLGFASPGDAAGPDATAMSATPDVTPQAFSTPPSTFGMPSPLTLPPALSETGLTSPTDVVPEPATWAMLIAGFGVIGTLLRRIDRARRLAAKPVVRRRKGQRGVIAAV